MADRRMYSRQVTRSDAFIELPCSAKVLYYDLNLEADDDGFVSNVKAVMKLTSAEESDLKALIDKRFIIKFESGVVVIKHWKINNLIRSDRYKETVYQEEKSKLYLKSNGAYSLMLTNGIPNDNQKTPQDSISKDSLYKVSKEEDININNKLYDTHAYAYESYDDIFISFGVSAELKDTFIEFIKHCQVAGKPLINDKLKNIIVRLDMAYDNDLEKIQSLKRAIMNGYYDIKEGKV